MDVKAHNGAETVYSILVLIVGMVTFCCFIAAVTNSMTQIQNMTAEASRQNWLLRRYMRERRVPQALKTRILRYLEYAQKAKKDFVSEARLSVLDMLSSSLRSELKYVVHYGNLLYHPLFRHAETLSEVVMHDLVETVLTKKSLADQDVEFQVSTMATHMSMVVAGEFAYHRSGESVQQVTTNDWMNEACIWVAWVCRGNLVAESDALLIKVESKSFIETMQTDAYLMPMMTCYAEVYCQWLNQKPADELSDVSCAAKSGDLIQSFIDRAGEVQADHEERAKKDEERDEKRRQMRQAQAEQSQLALVDVDG
jgi:hypothetical protein